MILPANAITDGKIQLLAALPAHQLKGSRIEVALFGSLSATGKGHGADRAAEPEKIGGEGGI